VAAPANITGRYRTYDTETDRGECFFLVVIKEGKMSNVRALVADGGVKEGHPGRKETRVTPS